MDPRNLLALAPAFLKAPLAALLDRLEGAERELKSLGAAHNSIAKMAFEMRNELDELKRGS